MSNALPNEADKKPTLRRQRQATFLDDATEYLLDSGIAGLSLESAAEALGVTHQTLLERFGSEDQLTAAVFENLRVRNVELIDARPTDFTLPTEQMLRGNWQQLAVPGGQRQFLLLFELVALHAREPGRFGPQVEGLVDDVLLPIEKNLQHNGWGAQESRQLATTMLAVFRGLYLDLAMTGDQKRVDQAMYRFIDMITSSH